MKNVKERLQNLNDILNELGEQDQDVKDFRILEKSGASLHILNYQISVLITKALNEGWVPDWNNSNQPKYYPWFNMSTGSCDDFNIWLSLSNVSARLCFKNSELAEYAGRQFNQYFKDYMQYIPSATSQDTISVDSAIAEPSKKVSDLKVVKTQEIDVNGTKRFVTIAVVLMEGMVRTGYAVLLPTDTHKEDRADKIATGRALSDKTNLTPDMAMGVGMDKKYILHAIADNFLRVISRGQIVKGIK